MLTFSVVVKFPAWVFHIMVVSFFRLGFDSIMFVNIIELNILSSKVRNFLYFLLSVDILTPMHNWGGGPIFFWYAC